MLLFANDDYKFDDHCDLIINYALKAIQKQTYLIETFKEPIPVI